MSGLYYETQIVEMVLGTKSTANVLSPVALTTTYTDNQKALATGGFVKYDLALKLTTGAGETATKLLVQLEHSPDGTNWYNIPSVSDTSGTSTIYTRTFEFATTAASTAYNISFGIDIWYKYVRCSFKTSGVSANQPTLSAQVTLSGK